jgi:hypothetical protein
MEEVKRTPSLISAWAIDPEQSIRDTSLTVVVEQWAISIPHWLAEARIKACFTGSMDSKTTNACLT